MKKAALLGLIYGGVSLLLTTILVFVDPKILFKPWMILVSSGIGMAILIGGGRYFLRQLDDVTLSFGVAFKYLFVAALIGSVVGALGSSILFAGNEELSETFVEYQKTTMENAAAWGAGLAGGDEATKEEARQEVRDQIESGEVNIQENPFAFKSLPLSLAGSIIGSLIVALIAAIFVRQKQ
ncbi:MAG: DUF4199 domain-containing protein [Bacteroidota bacterium]